MFVKSKKIQIIICVCTFVNSCKLTIICADAFSFKLSVLLIFIVSNNNFLNMMFFAVQSQLYKAKLIESF